MNITTCKNRHMTVFFYEFVSCLNEENCDWNQKKPKTIQKGNINSNDGCKLSPRLSTTSPSQARYLRPHKFGFVEWGNMSKTTTLGAKSTNFEPEKPECHRSKTWASFRWNCPQKTSKIELYTWEKTFHQHLAIIGICASELPEVVPPTTDPTAEKSLPIQALRQIPGHPNTMKSLTTHIERKLYRFARWR